MELVVSCFERRCCTKSSSRSAVGGTLMCSAGTPAELAPDSSWY